MSAYNFLKKAQATDGRHEILEHNANMENFSASADGYRLHAVDGYISKKDGENEKRSEQFQNVINSVRSQEVKHSILVNPRYLIEALEDMVANPNEYQAAIQITLHEKTIEICGQLQEDDYEAFAIIMGMDGDISFWKPEIKRHKSEVPAIELSSVSP